ncbi:hypothetical protein DITRI_Ditri04bG0072600 [Diplodiscus trichospermus]
MATEDQIEGTTSSIVLKSGVCCSDGNPQSETLTHLQELYTFKHDHSPKVRKPYTITKQREKWSEEEHQKFLEALRLYGRGWRQIEEHVGTKTAVQIRSHAQKFFSKVVRESNGGCESSIKPIEIPPPRPKRKPIHPYPRKSVDLLKGVSASSQPEKSPSPNHFVTEEDNKSPASVLSAFASDAVGSTGSEPHNGCSSPTSCTTNMQSISASPFEKENDYVTSNSSAEEEKPSLSYVNMFGHSSVEDIFTMKSNADLKDSVCADGDATTIFPFTSFKLFGKVVQVKDSHKPSIGAENLKSQAFKSGQEGIDAVSEMSVPGLASTYFDTRLSLGAVIDDWSRVPSRANPSPYMEIHPHKNDQVGFTSDAPLPWWAFYQGLPLYYFSSFNQTHTDSCVEERMKEKEILNERSCTGSDTGSVSQADNKEKNSDSVDSQGKHPCPGEKMTSQKCSKGFVPYKRCLAERDMSSSVVLSEERGSQRARVCS